MSILSKITTNTQLKNKINDKYINLTIHSQEYRVALSSKKVFKEFPSSKFIEKFSFGSCVVLKVSGPDCNDGVYIKVNGENLCNQLKLPKNFFYSSSSKDFTDSLLSHLQVSNTPKYAFDFQKLDSSYLEKLKKVSILELLILRDGLTEENIVKNRNAYDIFSSLNNYCGNSLIISLSPGTDQLKVSFMHSNQFYHLNIEDLNSPTDLDFLIHALSLHTSYKGEFDITENTSGIETYNKLTIESSEALANVAYKPNLENYEKPLENLLQNQPVGTLLFIQLARYEYWFKAEERIEKMLFSGLPDLDQRTAKSGGVKKILNFENVNLGLNQENVRASVRAYAEFYSLYQTGDKCYLDQDKISVPLKDDDNFHPYPSIRCLTKTKVPGNYHANFVVIGRRKYIAATGPNKKSISNFLSMIKQEKIKHVVNLDVYNAYHPTKIQKSKNGMTCIAKEESGSYIKYKLQMTDKTEFEMHALEWPDHIMISVSELHNYILKLSQAIDNKETILMYCEEGIGKTGTMILAYETKQDNLDSIEKVTSRLKTVRSQRTGAVQTKDQFELVLKYADYIKTYFAN